MDQDRLDKFIKNQIEHLETPADPDLFWQKLQKKQAGEKKPKRRFLLFWLTGGAMLISALLAFYFYQLNALNGNKIVHSNSQKIETESKTTAETTADTKSNIIVDSENSVKTKTNIASNKASTNLATAKESITTTTAQTSTDLNSSSSNSKVISASAKKEKPVTKQNTQSPNNNTITTVQNANKSSTLSIKKEEMSIATNEKNTNKPTTSGGAPPTPLSESDVLTNENKIGLQASTSTIKTLELPTSANSLDQPFIGLLFVNQQKISVPETPNRPSKKDRQKKWFLSTGAAFGYGLASRTLSINDAVDTDENYLKVREDMERSLDAMRINFDFRLQHKSGFYAKSGLEFEQITERFDSFVNWDSVYSVQQIATIKYAQDGTVTNETGDVMVSAEYFIKKKIYNRYRSFDIPLLIGYHSSKENKKWGWFVEGGASLNLQFKASGEIVSMDATPIQLEDNAQLFKSKTGISLLGNVGLTYELSERFIC